MDINIQCQKVTLNPQPYAHSLQRETSISAVILGAAYVAFCFSTISLGCLQLPIRNILLPICFYKNILDRNARVLRYVHGAEISKTKRSLIMADSV